MHIDQLAIAVGFKRSSLEELDSSKPPRENMHVWIADYAVLLAIQMDESTLEGDWPAMQTWLDDIILAGERKQKRVVDGYLIFLTERRPAARSRLLIEFNRTICRKYVIWPNASETPWSGLSRVSVLGLPLASTISEKLALPTPIPELEHLWRSVVDAEQDSTATKAACDLAQ